ncbi:MAG: hypothetical protein WC450_09895 [Candidatus Omnitrophota bacterium]|jgi:hypothetical protein
MQETKLHEDLIIGLKAKIKALRADKELFIKAQGMSQEAENLRVEAEKKREEIARLKASNAALITKKNAEVSKGLSGMIAKMKEVLPAGEPIITVEETGDIFIGWQREGGNHVAYSGLSGGEKVLFDNALATALKANILIVELAEVDDINCTKALEHFNGLDNIQILASSCHSPEKLPKDWTAVQL